MQNWNRFPRALLVFCLLIVLCAGLFAPRVDVVEAAPLSAVDEVSVVISEFRTRGTNGTDDEFVEIYNATGASVPIGGWKIQKSSGCGSTTTTLATIPSPTNLAAGQYYLVGNSTNYSGSTPLDPFLGSWSSIADDGGIALLNGVVVVDQVGLCSTTIYKEGTTLSPLSATTNQSYERKTSGSAGSCKDTDNNSADFILNASSSNPQNSSSALLPCLVVTSISSPAATYTTNQTVDITVMFSNNVNVTGSPTLLLETGVTDRNATYLSGTGSNSLVFQYTVVAGDTASDLDYVSANALSLNGGSITGAIGDATLVLPKPGTAGSLGSTSNIIIDNGTAPSVLSFQRLTPTSATTNAVSLIFRVTFSEAVTRVDAGDFTVMGTTTGFIGAPIMVTSNIYDVTISGGDLATKLFNGVVGLNLNTLTDITDLAANPLPAVEPPVDETYSVDYIPPTVVLGQSSSQADPAAVLPVNFTVAFSEQIDINTFVVADITQSGMANFVTWVITDSGDHMNFTLSAIASGNGTLFPSIGAGKVNDLAGNSNIAFLGGCLPPEPNNCVTLNDTTFPSVTINQAAAQADPTSSVPINFTVLFSEPINPSVFTTSDITQNGTSTGVIWSIANSGDNMTFTLSATAAGFGTIIPSMAANRVTDFVGNNNTASTSTDNSVTYQINTATARAIIINEVAWAGTNSNLTGDEWIELYNPRSSAINITGWTIKAADGAPSIVLNGSIPAGGYFLLERDDDSTVSDILADQIYTGELSNSGEALTLRDGANNVIDTANGNGNVWPAGSATTYGTMERVFSSSTETDSAWRTNSGVKRNGKNANNGDIMGTPKNSNSPLPTPTPTSEIDIPDTATPTPVYIPPDPRPIINEFLPRPGFDWNKDGRVDVFDEFVEIKNLTSIDINLGGWKLDDEANLGSNPYTFPDITLKPGQRVVYFALETNVLLSDGGDTVRLISPGGKIYDAYTYTIARVEDQSICRLPDGNVYYGWFEDCVPTPNLTNSREGSVPTSPEQGGQPLVCKFPDTLPADFLLAECHGYGANIWNADYWDQPDRTEPRYFLLKNSKWESIIE